MSDKPLPTDVETLRAMVLQRDATITAMAQTIGQQAIANERLEAQLKQLLSRAYGPKRERFSPTQGLLFTQADLDALAQESRPDAPPETPAVEHVEEAEAQKPPKKRRNRRLPGNLPRQTVRHELSDHERACPGCGEVRGEIGVETSEQLEMIPARFFVIVHERVKYACKSCQEHVTICAKPPQPIEKGLPGPQLLASCVVDKFGDHLPTYRIEDRASRSGLVIRRSTIGGWLAAMADLACPLYRLMIARVLRSRVIHTDDTPVPLLDPELDKTRAARFWGYLGDKSHRYIVYEFTESRRRDGPQTFLKDYSGYLQADAYGGYDGIYAHGQVKEVACWAHARRKWDAVKTLDPPRAHHALSTIGRLYKLEERLANASSTERRDARQEHSLPILQEFRQWLDVESPRLLPKSLTFEAAGYALNQWDALVRYCDDGDLAIDNNAAEREMRPMALGRKNWLFVGSPDAGQRAAILFSLVGSCKANQVEPQAYLAALFAELPKLLRDVRQSNDRAAESIPEDVLEAWLPDRWLQANPQHRWEIDAIRRRGRR